GGAGGGVADVERALEARLEEYTIRAQAQEATDRERAAAIQELDRRTRSPEPGGGESRAAVAEFEGRLRGLGEEAARWQHRAEARARKHKALREALAERARQAGHPAARLRAAAAGGRALPQRVA